MIDKRLAEEILGIALSGGGDFAEIYQELTQNGSIRMVDGKIDAIGVARQFLADGEWITKLIEDRVEDIRPCICCHNACFNFSSSKGDAKNQSKS